MCLKVKFILRAKKKLFFVRQGLHGFLFIVSWALLTPWELAKKKKNTNKDWVLYGKKLPYKSMNDITLNLIQTRKGLIPFL